MWSLLLLVLVVKSLEASELTCFFPGKTTQVLFGGQCLKYQLMYQGSCRSYFRLESSGLLCLLEPDVFNTARVNPDYVTCPSTEESDCMRYRRYCGGAHHVARYYPNPVPQGYMSPPVYNPGNGNMYGLPPLPSRDSYPSCSYSRCPQKAMSAHGLPAIHSRDNYSPRALYAPPHNTLSYCPLGTCRLGGQCVPNSIQGCNLPRRRNSDVKSILLRSFHDTLQTVLRTLQQKVNFKGPLLHA